MKKAIVDGCEAVARVAYKLSQVVPVYPITPSSPMAEYCTNVNAHGEKNLFGQDVKMIEMQAESGVAGTMHGALLSGALSTTFTSSQGLLLMLPNMFKIAGEHLPNVIHVSSRAVASHALNIFCDHSDVMAVRSSGYTIISSSSVQEAQDNALAAHLLAIKTSYPVLHFMDGFRTSHELQKIDLFEETDLQKFISLADIDALSFKKHALNPDSPLQYGTAQNPDTFFQNRIAASNKDSEILTALEKIYNDIYLQTGRKLAPYIFYGNKNAKNMIIAMGSSCQTIREYIENNNIKDVCLCSVKLFRPFLLQIPKTVTNICVLDRCKENGAASPLTLDVISALQTSGHNARVIKGIYGLGGKDFTPACVKAIIKNLKSKNAKDNFTVGIYDDVFNSSLPLATVQNNDNNFSIKIFGLGSDGSVSASKSTVKILGENHDKYVQGYFEYDSRKSGSMTISHIRICDTPILSAYLLQESNLIMISNFSFVYKYNCLQGLKDNGIVLINSVFNEKEIGKVLPKQYCDILKQKHAKVFTINASEIARQCGLNEKINIIMMTAMFKASNLLPFKKATQEIQEQIQKTFAKKGKSVVQKNIEACLMTADQLHKVDLRTLIGKKDMQSAATAYQSEFEKQVQQKILQMQGDTIPVSAFSTTGSTPTNTTKNEKRGIAQNLPNWIKENCIQCGRCVLACPHSALRALLVNKDNIKNPEDFAKAMGIDNALYKIQLSPLDCTGCGVCASTCPAVKKALSMTKASEILEKEKQNYQNYTALPQQRQNIFQDDYAKGLQFKKSYFEYPGACAGCGETPYIKLATMLFGDKMIIANATGCSSIYAGTYAACPYAKDDKGKGPAWANSLFEDNAEFGLGIRLGNQYADKQDKSVWIIGGDGWAYDIGFGGLDHTLASGENVNILVLDNQSYSNTGGQSSKATPMGANVKLAENSKRTHKKNLGQIAMTYPNVYVAQVALEADMTQCIKAFKEAQAHNGPSLIIAYAPCVNMGFNLKDMMQEQFEATACGYWPLYRYKDGKLYLDSKLNEDKYFDFLRKERRYAITFDNPQTAHLLQENKIQAVRTYNRLKEDSIKPE